MKSRPNGGTVLLILLFVFACVLGVIARRGQQQENNYVARAQYADATPLGGRGLALLLGRLGYPATVTTARLDTMPADARVWLILDPQTRFSRAEGKLLLDWVKRGGTLVWNVQPAEFSLRYGGEPLPGGIAALQRELDIDRGQIGSNSINYDEALPTLTPLTPGAVSVYWTGVKQASAGNDGLAIKRPFVEIAGSPVVTQLARIDYGQGRVFVTSGALLFTNYALSKPDNAVLVTNLIRAHVPAGTGRVYFDEREHGEPAGAAEPAEPSLLYYLWQVPVRYAVLQLLAAGLLLWAYYGRRLGAPVPLPDADPVTRAGQFAVAMGMLFQKAGRPHAAATIIGDEFRRALTRRLGMSVAQSDEEIAARAAVVTELPQPMITRLLLSSRAPAASEAEVLSDTQEMEYVLRRLKLH